MRTVETMELEVENRIVLKRNENGVLTFCCAILDELRLTNDSVPSVCPCSVLPLLSPLFISLREFPAFSVISST